MASTGEVWKLGRRPALDGLRGIAVLLVVASHLHLPHLRSAGQVGVSMFFALSGFLITSLLLEERAASGKIRLGRFYWRRFMRLSPALLGILAVVAAVTFAIGPVVATWPDIGLAAGYMTNWNAALTEPAGRPGALAHTWSLAVEEQFYVVWPLALLVLLRFGRRVAMVAASAGAAGALAFRIAKWDDWAGENRIYFGTDARADALLVGCVLALALHQSRTQPARRRLLATTTLTLVGLLSVLDPGRMLYVYTPAVVAVATSTIIWCMVTGTGSRLLSSRLLVHLGQRSYGLYLWHFPLALIALPWLTWHLGAGAAVVSVAAGSYGCAWLSWRYVEAPAMRLRAPRSGQPVASDPGAGDGVLGVADPAHSLTCATPPSASAVAAATRR